MGGLCRIRSWGANFAPAKTSCVSVWVGSFAACAALLVCWLVLAASSVLRDWKLNLVKESRRPLRTSSVSVQKASSLLFGSTGTYVSGKSGIVIIMGYHGYALRCKRSGFSGVSSDLGDESK